jgi:hypothetical protein
VTDPLATVKEMPSTATLSPKRLVRPWTEMIVCDESWSMVAGIRANMAVGAPIH